MGEQDALEGLQELLRANKELVRAQEEANRLAERDLACRQQEAANQARGLELEAQRIALEKERLRRAEARLHEVLNRYAALAERFDLLLNYLQNHPLNDDAQRDFQLNLSERFESFERAIMLALMDKLESPQIQAHAQQVVSNLEQTLNTASKRRQLLSWHKTLNLLEERLAEGDDDIKIVNKIERAKEEIARLGGELNVVGTTDR